MKRTLLSQQSKTASGTRLRAADDSTDAAVSILSKNGSPLVSVACPALLRRLRSMSVVKLHKALAGRGNDQLSNTYS